MDMQAMGIMGYVSDESDDNVSSLEEGLASKRTVEKHEKPLRYSSNLTEKREYENEMKSM